MNLRAEMKRVMDKIEQDEMPASESSRYIQQALNNPDIIDCPHLTDNGCAIIDHCDNTICEGT